ncbi:MAG: UDP-N-acetylmuramoyl-tripeptide--D-alanyl-D-alanine ligase [Clostridia bacterium]|nr:UDP-N-acetylmuramoyl-tripeptide--D-alanyl-D-alanine ligase [Clostridia bacterium]
MKELLVKDILNCSNGKLVCGNEDIICKNFSKDSREVKEGDVYLGIKGENFNGSLFYKDAIKNGATVCILQDVEIDYEYINKLKNKVIILVDDVASALIKIATYKKSLYNIPTIAITGSVGKTSTKDIIASVVSQKYKTLKTEGNYNNQIGMPLTMLQLEDHEAAVIEMGADKFGDISLLSKIAKPSIAIFTIIGSSHLESFKSRENILKAKFELLEGLSKDKVAIINNDNDLLHQWIIKNREEYENKGYKIITYGINNISDIMPKNINITPTSSFFDIVIDNNNYNVEVPIGGKHFIYNSLPSFAIAKILNIDIENVIKGIKKFKLTKMRMEVKEYSSNTFVINDTYNASLDSMKAGLDYLKDTSTKNKIAVLGGMLELGKYSDALHKEVGRYVAKINPSNLITIGKEAKLILEEAILYGYEKQRGKSADNNEQAIEYLLNIPKEDTTIYIKASRSMKLEEICNALDKKLK